MSDSGRHPDARVRAALPTELEDVARVLTRAFVNDPAMNWFGGVKEPVRDLDNPATTSEQKTVRNQNWFQRAAVKATFLINGFVDVVVIPSSSEGEGGSGKEEIVAVAIWFPPGESLDLPPATFVRAGMLKVIWGWGLSSTKVSAVRMLQLICAQVHIGRDDRECWWTLRRRLSALLRRHSRLASLTVRSPGTCLKSWSTRCIKGKVALS